MPSNRGSAIDQRDTKTPTINAEHRIACCNPHIAPECEFQPSSHGKSFHCRDDGLCEHYPRASERSVAVSRDPVAIPICGAIEIGPRAEATAGTGENRNPQRLVRIEASKRTGERLGGLTIYRVAHLGAGNGNNRDSVFGFKADDAGCHD